MQLIKILTLAGVAGFLMQGCATRSNVLEPIAESADTDLEKSMAENPTYSQLKERLKTLAYEDVGLQYESEATLKLLLDVFSDPRAAHKDIALVYTGAALSYDPKSKGLTVGGTPLKEAILKFIESKIPARK